MTNFPDKNKYNVLPNDHKGTTEEVEFMIMSIKNKEIV